ncbi:OmpA family protein [Kangiella sp. HZ709]|nr:OmpA family protein [Kangiella sp. HZ709]
MTPVDDVEALNDDFSGTPIDPVTGGSPGNIFDNDTINGDPADDTNVDSITVTNDGGLTGVTIDTDGNVNIPPGTAPGTYVITYEICTASGVCDTATITVVVGTVEAMDDDFSGTPIDPVAGGSPGNIFDNDTINGDPADNTNVDSITVTNDGGLTGVIIDSDGNVNVPPGTAPGTYVITYEICNADGVCDTATITVVVGAVEAMDDDFSGTPIDPVAGGSPGNIFDNDTINGDPADNTNVDSITVTNDGGLTGVIIDSDGNVNVPPGTAPGTYVITYEICNADGVCDTATITIVVESAEIIAIDDDLTGNVIIGADGGIAGNAFVNDTLDGNPVDETTVSVTVTNDNGTGITISSAGEVIVPANTRAGTYVISYEICEIANPTNCDTADVTVEVIAPVIDAVNDDFSATPINGFDGGVVGSIFDNDTLNNVALDPTLVNLTVTNDGGSGATVNTDGTITVPAGTAAGTYTLEYQICEILNPTNCDTATVIIVVEAPVIVANDDDFTADPISGVTGGDAGNAFDNDTLNDAAIDPSLITVTVLDDAGIGATIASDGTVSIPPGTAGGVYTITYEICEIINPTNCDTATITIRVIEIPAIRLVKTASVSQASIGDFVTYNVTVENIGQIDASNISLVDTPPLGMNYVEGSGAINDLNPANDVITAGRPISFDGVDVAAGETVVITYMMRIGATAIRGELVNTVVAEFAGQTVSNEATVAILMSADPDFEQSTILGKVFNDRDADGWQDDATATGIQVTGGIDESAYIANSTTLDVGNGPVSLSDASAPINHGITIENLSGRNSSMDPASNHQVVISQMMTEPKFTSSVVITTAEGSELIMAADGTVTSNSTGDLARGLSAQKLSVERLVTLIEGNYKVDFIITNHGIQERGIPGVRIATVEGLIIETDAYGRFHLNAIDVADFGRGQNFIMKVDPATLPKGSEFTTENPRVKRLTQGLPTSFDFGVKIPETKPKVRGIEAVEIELGTILFDDNSAEIKPQYQEALVDMADAINKYQGGTITIDGHGGGLAIAFDRAQRVREALLDLVEPELHEELQVSLIASPELHVAGREIITIGERVILGSVFFETNKADVKPTYSSLIKNIAGYLNKNGGGAIRLAGHTDIRADKDYNYQLGLRRAKSIYAELIKQVDKSYVDEVRVETSSREFAVIEGGEL